MNVSNNGIELIKKHEGCELKAYKDSTGVLTIGYGLTNACKNITGLTITASTTITRAQAEKYLIQVLNAKYVPLVNKYDSKYHWNQNQLDAMTSFCYNVGSIDQLTANGTRTIAQISAKITAYNKAGGKVLTGLVNRRRAEKELFDKPVQTTQVSTTYTQANFIADVEKILNVTTVTAALNKTVEISKTKNKHHALVTPLERYMKAIGYYSGTVEADEGKTPSFGNGMYNAVINYQKKVVKSTGKNVDGVLSAKGLTWKKLLGIS